MFPREYMVLSHIMLLSWFTFWTNAFSKVQRYNETMQLIGTNLLNSIMLFVVTTILLFFRKPPDRIVQMGKMIVIQTQRKIVSTNRVYKLLTAILLLCNGQLPIIEQSKTTIKVLTAKKEEQARDIGNWASDSTPIVIDSATTKTITPHLSDLINPEQFKRSITGLGKGTITHKGQIKWKVMDDQGRQVYLEDDEAYYSPDAPYRLLCPHSWKNCMDQRRFKQGETTGDQANLFMADDNQGYVLTWNRGKTSVSVPLDAHTNLPTIQGSSRYDEFKSFACAFTSFPTIIPDDDDDHMGSTMQMNDDSLDPIPSPTHEPQVQNFTTDNNSHEQPTNIDDPLTHRDEQLFLSWHLKLGHTPFKNVRWMSKQGLLPPKLQHCRNVVCPACLYGKQRRRPWRYKGETQRKIKKATAPGECVSVDQLISGTPGLVAQTTGKLTTSRYSVATIFVDHYSDLDYVHVQESTSASDTIEAKMAFEKFSKDRGVQIKHYHADNGIFASNGFRDEVSKSNQSITFCGVGAHHQNGVAERRIQDLCESTRAMLIHAAHRNPSVTANLWPYALNHASYVRRMIPRDGHSKSPEEFFTKAPVRPTTKFLHPFGCPVYVLHHKLQGGGRIPKWDERSRVGVYLGHSKQHATSVALILNPKSGFVSPQFHCVFDDQFDSVANDANFNDLWAQKAGLQYQQQEEDSYLQTEIPEHFIVPFESDAPMIPTEPEPNETEEMLALDNDAFEPDLPEPDFPEPVENANAPNQEQPIIMQQNEGDPQLGPTT